MKTKDVKIGERYAVYAAGVRLGSAVVEFIHSDGLCKFGHPIEGEGGRKTFGAWPEQLRRIKKKQRQRIRVSGTSGEHCVCIVGGEQDLLCNHPWDCHLAEIIRGPSAPTLK